MNLQGLNKQQVEESRQKHGANTLTQIPPEPLWKKILEGFKDPMIMILLVALVIQVVLCFMGEAHWYEPVGILIAIMIANGVSAISENQQEGKASALKAEEEAKEVAKVLRDGKMISVRSEDLVVGDVVVLEAGDSVPADCRLFECASLKVEEAALTGESVPAEKMMTVLNCGEDADIPLHGLYGLHRCLRQRQGGRRRHRHGDRDGQDSRRYRSGRGEPDSPPAQARSALKDTHKARARHLRIPLCVPGDTVAHPRRQLHL